MSSATELPLRFVNPRPGVLKTLGICNIVFAVIGGACVGSSLIFTIIGSAMQQAQPEVKVDLDVQVKAAPGSGAPMSAGFNPFMGLQDINFVRFCYIDNAVGLVMNLLMFATGIGLLNLKYWGATWWSRIAWVRIVSVFLVWSYFIVGVIPSYSETSAREIMKFYIQSGIPVAQLPPVAFMTRVYSISFLIVALGAMLMVSAYPVISLWMLSRPGVKAAIIDRPVLEVEQL